MSRDAVWGRGRLLSLVFGNGNVEVELTSDSDGWEKVRVFIHVLTVMRSLV